jgi:hypothetical protein
MQPTHVWTSTPVQQATLPEAERVNAEILAGFARLAPEDYRYRSHFIAGRFENLYLERTRLPGIERVLGHAVTCARAILGSAPAVRLGSTPGGGPHHQRAHP